MIVIRQKEFGAIGRLAKKISDSALKKGTKYNDIIKNAEKKLSKEDKKLYYRLKNNIIKDKTAVSRIIEKSNKEDCFIPSKKVLEDNLSGTNYHLLKENVPADKINEIGEYIKGNRRGDRFDCMSLPENYDINNKSNKKIFKDLLKYHKSESKKFRKQHNGKDCVTEILPGTIHLQSNKCPSALAHEAGHAKRHIAGKRPEGYDKHTIDRFFEDSPKSRKEAIKVSFKNAIAGPPVLREEWGASKEGLKLLKSSGASKEQLKEAKKQLKAAYKTYKYDYISSIFRPISKFASK